MNPAHNFYIHVPYCLSKCRYCAFYSVPVIPNWETYANKICDEINFWGQKIGRVVVPTIFFGGGTPSLMPISVFEKIISCINNNFDIAKDCEITIEANPDTLDKDKLNDFIKNGLNRLSIGVQSLNDTELEFLGRHHNVATAVNLINIAQSCNINVSADFIYGLPNQKVEDIQEMCKKINALNLTHVSLYELTIEENTPFGKMQLNMPDNDTMANMYMTVSEYLDLPKYEISNYAKHGYECKHNQNIWYGNAYIGCGPTAAGRPFFDNKWHEQLGNNALLQEMNDDTRAIEKIITGLRTVRGVALTTDVVEQLNWNWIKENNNLVLFNDKYLYTSDKGMLLLDKIMADLIK
ncbi:MAG: radical SAM family heme chaperone HemW [Alphaproteobacteria bacterium]|nr:radical SAM family heme chaperone HemW [Alphaproteobacteria bacterium]